MPQLFNAMRHCAANCPDSTLYRRSFRIAGSVAFSLQGMNNKELERLLPVMKDLFKPWLQACDAMLNTSRILKVTDNCPIVG